MGMEGVAGLSQELDRHDARGLAEARRSSLKRGEAAVSARVQFRLEDGQGAAVDDGGKGLGKACERRNGDCAARDSGMVEKVNQQRRRQERKVNRDKDSKARGARGQSATNPGQWASARRHVGNDRSELREAAMGSGNRSRKVGRTESGERVRNQRPAAKHQQSLVAAHARGSAAGKNKAGGVVVESDGHGLVQRPSHPNKLVPAPALLPSPVPKSKGPEAPAFDMAVNRRLPRGSG